MGRTRVGRTGVGREHLRADCARCTALCCSVPAFGRSADFAIDKPAGIACPHLASGFRCGIHDRLGELGFPGCRAFDCLGAGQRVVAAVASLASDVLAVEVRHADAAGVDAAGVEAAGVEAAGVEIPGIDVAVAFPLVLELHELLWYLEEVLDMPAAAPLHRRTALLRDEVDSLAQGPSLARLSRAAPLARAESDRVWSQVDDVLRQASALAREGLRGPDLRRADLAGRDLRRCDLAGADLRGAFLLGADLQGAVLDRADLVGADLRGADLRGADLSTALFLVPTQVASARGDGATRLPTALLRPAHWPPPVSSARPR